MNILYSDEHLAAAVKPCGVLSEIDENKPNMPSLLCEALGCETVYPVHRLDRTTQGVMVYAKTPEAARRLSEAFQAHKVDKTYLAVVGGVPTEPEGELTDLLFYDRRAGKSYVVRRKRASVKEARLSYRLLDTGERDGNKIALLGIKLYTGRTHQIRAQFASRGMPLVGDRRYGSRVKSDDIMLCAYRLCLTHPFTGEELCFEYEPEDFFQ